MELKRFFATRLGDGTVRIDGEEYMHLAKVLRHKVGYRLIANAADGKDLYCTIARMDKECAIATIEREEDNIALPEAEITLFQANSKREKMDWIIQKCVELGVRQVVPMYTQFVNEKNFALERAERIADQACKQCGRSLRMQVSEPVQWQEVLQMLGEFDAVILPYEHATNGAIGAVSTLPQARKIAILIGSEGGFSESEVEQAQACGAQTVSLGKQILRCETAAIVACALVLYHKGALQA